MPALKREVQVGDIIKTVLGDYGEITKVDGNSVWIKWPWNKRAVWFSDWKYQAKTLRFQNIGKRRVGPKEKEVSDEHPAV